MCFAFLLPILVAKDLPAVLSVWILVTTVLLLSASCRKSLRCSASVAPVPMARNSDSDSAADSATTACVLEPKCTAVPAITRSLLLTLLCLGILPSRRQCRRQLVSGCCLEWMLASQCIFQASGSAQIPQQVFQLLLAVCRRCCEVSGQLFCCVADVWPCVSHPLKLANCPSVKLVFVWCEWCFVVCTFQCCRPWSVDWSAVAHVCPSNRVFVYLSPRVISMYSPLIIVRELSSKERNRVSDQEFACGPQ